jgi:activating signal cointegrator complex subunit 1
MGGKTTLLDPNVQLLVVNGRTYRVHVAGDEPTTQAAGDAAWVDDLDDEPGCVRSDEGDGEDDENVVAEGDRFVTRWHVEPSLYKFLIGAKGATKKQLESETQTEIRVPGLGSRDTQACTSYS